MYYIYYIYGHIILIYAYILTNQHPLINQGVLIGWIGSRDFLINIIARSHSRGIIAYGRNKKLYFYGTQTHTDWLDLPNPTNNAYPLDILIVVNLRATLEIGAHSIREIHKPCRISCECSNVYTFRAPSTKGWDILCCCCCNYYTARGPYRTRQSSS